MPTPTQVLSWLEDHPGAKAESIARAFGTTTGVVCEILYRGLKGKVHQDADWRWWPGTRSKPAAHKVQASPATPLAHLCRYYLACIARDIVQEASAWADNADPDYAELQSLPFGPDPVRETAEAARIREKAAGAKGLALFLGYPVRLRAWVGRSGKMHRKVEPVFLLPINDEAATGPLLNQAVLGRLAPGGAAAQLEEALDLGAALGLDAEDTPDPEEVFWRLPGARPDWPWREEINPQALSSGTPLARLDGDGIWNRAVLIVAKREKFTVGLERELDELAKMPEAAYLPTALGGLVSGGPQTRGATPNGLLELVPLNTEQRRAVERALVEPLTVITGPPGTGKSQVVTAIVANAIWNGQSVLFASKNNKAVDVVTERANGFAPRPALLRVGGRGDFGPKLLAQLTRVLNAVVDEADAARLDALWGEHRHLVERIAEAERDLSRLAEARAEVDRLGLACEAARAAFGAGRFAALLHADTAALRPVVRALSVAAAHASRDGRGALARFAWPLLRRGRLAALRAAARAAHGACDALGVAPPPFAHREAAVEPWMLVAAELGRRIAAAETAAAYGAALRRLTALPTDAALHLRASELAGAAESVAGLIWPLHLARTAAGMGPEAKTLLSNFVAELQNALGAGDGVQPPKTGKVVERLLGVLPCWAVTSLSVRGRVPMQPGMFDLVVVDEASQCDIPSAIPLLFRARRAVVIGDPMQLRHITRLPARQDQTLLEANGLADTRAGWSYRVRSLFDLAASLCEPGAMVALREHRRSHQDIIGISEGIYDRRLEVATRLDRLRRPAGEARALRWVDVRGEARQPFDGSTMNEDEAREVVRQLRDLLVTRDYTGTVGVVTPFRAQEARIRELVEADAVLRDRGARAALMVDTVHGFQGDERDVMLFSPVVGRGVGEGALRFLRNNGNLLNVAITRARALLLVVGDRAAATDPAFGLDHLAHCVRACAKATHDPLPPEPRDHGPDYPWVSRPAGSVSEWEQTLYRALHREGFKPEPQYPADRYFVDLALFAGGRRLAIEVDGEHHRDRTGDLTRRDRLRQMRLIEMGWEVRRFWVWRVRDDLERVVAEITDWVGPDGERSRNLHAHS